MKSPQTSRMLAVLAALAQESRLGVFRLLVEHSPDGLTAGDIAQRVGLPAATLSFHLKALAHADLVVGRAEGRFLRYRANIDAMNALVAYLSANCCAQSTTRDPACAPKVQQVPVEAIGRMPRRIARR
jgi:ArsR family transcriptional regulator, arsenate/arsenite/antimonite-responsive transcriptional repressor